MFSTDGDKGRPGERNEKKKKKKKQERKLKERDIAAFGHRDV